MKIAIPVSGGCLSSHFGHCEHFSLFDTQDGRVTNHHSVTPPPHEPGAYPKWLRTQGVDVIIAGGMGRRAQDIFSQEGIKVVYGVSSTDPSVVVEDYLKGQLKTGDNICDH